MPSKGLRRSASEDFNQTAVERVLRLIRLMRKPFRRSRLEYAELLGVSERSVYRYFNLVESLGFTILTDGDRNVYIPGEDLRETFTDQEALWVQQALDGMPADHAMSRSVLRKLRMHSEQEEVLDALLEADRAQVLTALADAIHQRQPVVLLGYHSAHSGTRTDRLVEPIELLAQHTLLSAYEVDSRRNKYFRIDRISAVQMGEGGFRFLAEHRALLPDFFGFSIPEEGALLPVHLELSMRAALFLRTEHPLSIPYLRPASVPGRFVLQGGVVDLRPLLRFLQGFSAPEDFTVLGGEALLRATAPGSEAPGLEMD
jgi:hypothetical protein